MLCWGYKMLPGMNPRKMQQMMKKMGIAQQEVDATEVIIKTAEKEIVDRVGKNKTISI